MTLPPNAEDSEQDARWNWRQRFKHRLRNPRCHAITFSGWMRQVLFEIVPPKIQPDEMILEVTNSLRMCFFLKQVPECCVNKSLRFIVTEGEEKTGTAIFQNR